MSNHFCAKQLRYLFLLRAIMHCLLNINIHIYMYKQNVVRLVSYEDTDLDRRRQCFDASDQRSKIFWEHPLP